MSDRRELILERLTDLMGTIEGVKKAERNRDEISERSRPAIIILDADEEAAEGAADRGRPAVSPNLVTMTPELYVLLGNTPADVGTELNSYRASIIKAVLTDTDLAAIVGTNGQIRYEGCATGLSRGRSMEGEMGLSFSFTYPLNPALL